MRVTVRHGINGDEELTTQVVAGVTVGWDLMEQMARKLALDSPFQIVLYLSCTAGILSPVRTISSQMAPLDLEVCYLVQKLQYPTAEHYQTIMTALYEKDVIDLLHLLGQGIDLTWKVPDVGTPAHCSHWQSFETTTVTHTSFKPPRTYISLGLGSTLRICSCNRWLTPTSSLQSSSRRLCWNWQLSLVTHT